MSQCPTGFVNGRPLASARDLVAGCGFVNGPPSTDTPAPPVEFTPLALNPLRAYHAPWDYDGSAPSAVASRWQNSGVADGDPVEFWTDWSDEESHAVQSTLSKQARLFAASSGLFGLVPSYSLDGVNDAYVANLLNIGLNGLTVFFVGAPASAVKFIYEHGSNASTSPGSWMLAIPEASGEFAARYQRGVNFNSQRAQFADGQPHIVMQRYTPGAPDPHKFDVDGLDDRTSESVSGSPAGDLAAQLYIGSRLAGTLAAYQGLFTSFWVFNALTDEECTQVYNWLYQNTGFP